MRTPCTPCAFPLPPPAQIRFVLLLSRQGKVRLAKWYTTLSQKERAKITKEVTSVVLARAPKLCNFVDWKDQKIVYKRYASLYFIAGIDQGAWAAAWARRWGQGAGEAMAGLQKTCAAAALGGECGALWVLHRAVGCCVADLPLPLPWPLAPALQTTTSC